ncbi:MAG: hypothetical protein MUQ65_03800 [Armatimonadetes bacterium]|nr:hypothetical protein [Armatimonadota bacterium]
MTQQTSRERLLAAIDGPAAASVPCCFMIFSALRRQCKDECEFVDRQLELGLDARVQVDDLPIRFGAAVELTEEKEAPAAGGTPLLRRTYRTPAGELTAVVKQTEDWPYGDRLPLFDDYFTPRAVKFPITQPSDLDALRHLLPQPNAEEIATFRERAARRKAFAHERGVVVAGGWKSGRHAPGEDEGLMGANGGTGTVVDALMWLCGGTEPLMWAYDEPEFLSALIGLIEDWNRRRLEIHLEVGLDIVVRRAWYEGTEFWSPDLYRQVILPGLARDAALAHQYGARFAYIITSGMMPIADALCEAGIDVIIGVDPGEGKGTTVEDARDVFGGKIALWGGVSGPLAIEEGSESQVRQAVEEAMECLDPTGRFILSPVDNVRAETEQARRNVRVFIDTWKALAAGAR